MEPLSLKSLPFSLFPFLSLFLPLFSPTPTVGSSWSGGRVLHLPHVSLLLAHLDYIPSHPLSIVMDFHPLRRCHMSTWAPLGSPILTNYTHDTWHLLSHSNYAKCPTLPLIASKNVKFRLSRNSTKLDVVARFRETIPILKFVLPSEI